MALGKFRELVKGDVEPHSILILVEWESQAAFESYCNDPALVDQHEHRVNRTDKYAWQLCDKLEALRPILK